MSGDEADTPAVRAVAAMGLDHRVVTFGRVRSLEEAAGAQGLTPGQVLKTIVVRRADDDHLLVLVPGGRRIAWPLLRAHLGVNRITLPDADAAYDVTGYVRGTITPFGTRERLPVLLDAAALDHDVVTVGGGAHGVSIHLAPDVLAAATGAEVAEVTEPA